VLAHGYNYSVDWWGLGVLTYVLLTGRQPFSSPKTDDPMVVMRRIVDEQYVIKYPPFLSPQAKVSALGCSSALAKPGPQSKRAGGLVWSLGLLASLVMNKCVLEDKAVGYCRHDNVPKSQCLRCIVLHLCCCC
jgi:serine/threonine protein kinase